MLVERIRSHGEAHGGKETSVEAELCKEIEGCRISKKNETEQIVKNTILLFYFLFFVIFFGLLSWEMLQTYTSQILCRQPMGRNGPSSSHNGPDRSSGVNDPVSTAGILNTT